MDVKPRPLSCMKKLPLTCEIKLQIHRPGIERTLPAGPREAGSSPAGRWQAPAEAPRRPRCRGRAAGRSHPAARGGPGRGAWPGACVALRTVGGQGRGPRSVREGFAGRGGTRGREPGGMRRRWAVVPSSQQEPPGGEKGWGGILGDVVCKGHVCTSRSYASPWQEGTSGDPLPPLLGDGTGGSAPRPRRGPQLAAGAASPPLSPAAPAWQKGFATALKTRFFPRRDRFTSNFHVAKVAYIFSKIKYRFSPFKVRPLRRKLATVLFFVFLFFFLHPLPSFLILLQRNHLFAATKRIFRYLLEVFLVKVCHCDPPGHSLTRTSKHSFPGSANPRRRPYFLKQHGKAFSLKERKTVRFFQAFKFFLIR